MCCPLVPAPGQCFSANIPKHLVICQAVTKRMKVDQVGSHLQLADASHGAGKQHQEHPGRQGAAAVASCHAMDGQVSGHQRRGACCVGADTGSSQPKCVGDAADQEVHAIARRHIGCDLHPETCVHTTIAPLNSRKVLLRIS